MATLATLVVKLRAEIGDFVKGLDDAERQAKKFGKQLSDAGRAASEGLTLPIVAAGVTLFKFAADAMVTERRFNLAFGTMAGDARAFSERLAADLGLSAEDIRKAMTPVEQSLHAMGLNASSATAMTEGLVKLAEDLSVTTGAGRDVDDIMHSLQRGLSGATRGLKDLGIVVDQHALKAEALRRGMIGLHETLSVGQKAWLTYQIIMQQTSNLQGAFAKASDDPIVQLRRIKEQAGDVARELGTALMPAFITLLGLGRQLADRIRELADWFRQLPEGLRETIVYVGVTVAAIGPLLFVFGKLWSAVTALITILRIGGLALSFLATNPVGQVILAIGILTAVVIKLSDYTNWMQEQFVLAWTFIVDKVQSGLAWLLHAAQTIAHVMGNEVWATALGNAEVSVRASNERMLAHTAQTITQLDALIDSRGRNIRPSSVGRGGLVTGGLLPPITPAITDVPGGISNLPSQAARIAEALRLMHEQFAFAATDSALVTDRMHAMGQAFNEPAARAQALHEAMKKIAESGAGLDQVLNASGLTLRQLGQQYSDALEQARRFTDEQKLLATVNEQMRSGIGSGIGAMASQIGNAIGGAARGFKGLTSAIEGIIGDTAVTIGKAMIAFGIAGLAISQFITNPALAIAAGAALVALGSALASSAQGSMNAMTGGGSTSGALASASTSSTSPSSDGGSVVVVNLPGSGFHLYPNDTRAVDEFAHMLDAVKGRNIKLVFGGM